MNNLLRIWGAGTHTTHLTGVLAGTLDSGRTPKPCLLLTDSVRAISVLIRGLPNEAALHEAFENSAICPTCPSLDMGGHCS